MGKGSTDLSARVVSLVDAIESAADGIRGSIGVLEDRIKEQAELNKDLKSVLCSHSDHGGVVDSAAPVESGEGESSLSAAPLWSAVAARSVGAGEPASSPVSRLESRPAPRRLDGSGSSFGARRSLPAVIVRTAGSGTSVMDAIRSIRSKFSPLNLGIKRIRTREAASGGFVLEVLDADGGAKADLLATKIRAALGVIGCGYALQPWWI